MGMGVNGVTGDYSRGANGFWIENGKLSFPVSEMTIAGNLIEIYKNIPKEKIPPIIESSTSANSGGGLRGIRSVFLPLTDLA